MVVLPAFLRLIETKKPAPVPEVTLVELVE
jgi:hypothetical protein